MKRTRIPQPSTPADAILAADLHLSDTAPSCRTDDYIAAQEAKLRFLRNLSQAHDGCPVLCAGDVFHRWKASPWLCSWAFNNLPRPFVTVPGNHDLPMHSMDLYDKSALALLETVDPGVHVLKGGWMEVGGMCVVGIPFGMLDRDINVPESVMQRARRRILLLHEMVWPDKKPTWGINSWSAEEIIERFGDKFDLIVTGDNHDSFAVRAGDTILVNPGSMMRLTVDQAEFQPKVYLYYYSGSGDRVVPVELPIELNVHKLDHPAGSPDDLDKIMAYIRHLDGEGPGGLSFRRNLEWYFRQNRTPRKIRELIWQHLDGEGDISED